MSLKDLTVSEGVILFTDGSSNSQDRSGGWAYIALDAFDGEHSAMGGDKDTTNNRMEMTAWIIGLEDLLRYHGPCIVMVVSDSQYVGLGVTNRTRKRNTNLDLWVRLDLVVDAHEYIEFEWVKGHKGDYWNETVDKLAGEARIAYNYPAE